MFAWFCIFVCASAGCLVAAEYTMPGQPLEVPVNSAKVLRAARFAMVEFNRDNAEDLFAYKIVNITSAKIQVVAGINYILEVKLGRTMCKTSDTIDTEPCLYHSEPKELKCHFVVTEIPWEDSRVLTQNKCHHHGSN
ncbi:cystatin-like [Dicentrarchus labrax]|uniref:Cystatin domain-containing protein n=1 Tax=Dicentrarchus labrax TaxID=13489 RepID=A0A8P4GLZ3_DICLA|nr:cystatin-like [Dicentrarchus labrax]XP_051234718.1 cystatin-like [Dicentrarchus labrax]XP_051234727.1 cystatin-like [Dicentrarchus labrax]